MKLSNCAHVLWRTYRRRKAHHVDNNNQLRTPRRAHGNGSHLLVAKLGLGAAKQVRVGIVSSSCSELLRPRRRERGRKAVTFLSRLLRRNKFGRCDLSQGQAPAALGLATKMR